MENLLEIAGVWCTVLLTLAVFSFLYRDNPIYKAAEHLYVGIAAGYTFYQAFRATIYPNLVQHLLDGAKQIHANSPDGWPSMWRLGALVLGLLMLSRLVPKWTWVSRWPMALVVGAFAGLNLVGFARANLVDQVSATMIPLAGRIDGGTGAWMPFWPVASPSAPAVLNHLVLVAGVVSVLVYFFFGREQSKAARWTGTLGIWFVMLTFGATYGSIVLGRVSLLIGRTYILTDVNQPRFGYPTYLGTVLMVAVLVIWRVWFFKPELTLAEEADANAPPKG